MPPLRRNPDIAAALAFCPANDDLRQHPKLALVTDTVHAANSQTLGYDALNRLSSATSGSGGYGTYGWTWDPVNNVQTQTINSTTTTFSQNSGTNQLSQSVTGSTTTTVDTTSNGNIADFKIAGTTISSNSYNAANQLSSATGPLGASATNEYGFDGQRLLKTPSSGYPITYQYSRAANELLSENDLHSGQTADYIYMDPGKDSRPIGQVDPTSGNVYYTHTDRQGTPQALTDSGASVAWSATYNPFGDTSSFSGTLTTQSVRLPGQYFDPETGNNHNGFRDYAGALTRYVQSDPIGLAGGMNTYQYVKGNPFKYIDPRGLDPKGGGGGQCTPGSTDPMCATGGGGGSPCDSAGGAPSPQFYQSAGSDEGAFGLPAFAGGLPLDAQRYGAKHNYANYVYGVYMSSAGFSLGTALWGAQWYGSVLSTYTNPNVHMDGSIPSANTADITNGFNAQQNGTLCSTGPGG